VQDDPGIRSQLIRSKQKLEEHISELEIECLTPIPGSANSSEDKNPPSLETLAGYIEDPDPVIRHWAVGEMVAAYQSQAFPYLLKTSRDSDPDVRIATVNSLAEFGLYAIRPLIALMTDRDYRVRNCVALTLGRIGPAALPYLLPVLKDEFIEKHLLAVTAIRGMGQAVEPQLREMLRWPYPNLVYSVITALGETGTAESVPLLQPLAEGHWQPTTWGGSISEAAGNAIKRIKRRYKSLATGSESN
jgi:HEAT repeat protein